MNKKYGNSPIARNWNRMAELSQMSNAIRTKIEAAELAYRISIQQEYANTKKIAEGFIEPK